MPSRLASGIVAAALALGLCALLDAGLDVSHEAFWVAAGGAGLIGGLVHGG
jgi:hypothetical protein